MRAALLITAILALGACSQMPSPPPEVLAEATRVILTDTDWPAKGDEARRWVQQKVLVPVDATPSVETDWMIDPERSETASLLCGTGGCERQIWSRSPSGQYVPVFKSRVRQMKIRHTQGQYRIDVDYHGTHCGLSGADACPVSYVWTGGTVQIGADPETGFHILLPDKSLTVAPLMQAIEPATQAPQEIADMLSAARASCAQTGRTFQSEGVVNRLPDLNGDGVREWAWDGLNALCSWDETIAQTGDPCAGLTCENRIYVSRQSGTGETEWIRLSMDPTVPYGLKTCNAGRPEVVELIPEQALPADCDCSSQCGQKTLSAIPNTQN